MSCHSQIEGDSLSTLQNNGKIFEGSRFPAVVKIMADDGGTCTGTNMGPYILTAAHCVEVALGDSVYSPLDAQKIQVSMDGGKSLMRASQVELAPGYKNDRIWKYDLAKIRLTGSATTSHAKASLGAPAVKGSAVTVVGFGCTFDCNNSVSTDHGVLRSGLNNVAKVSELIEIVGPSQTQSSPGQTVAYPGDSGGPLFDARGEVVGVLTRTATFDGQTISSYVNVNDPSNKAFVQGSN